MIPKVLDQFVLLFLTYEAQIYTSTKHIASKIQTTQKVMKFSWVGIISRASVKKNDESQQKPNREYRELPNSNTNDEQIFDMFRSLKL